MVPYNELLSTSSCHPVDFVRIPTTNRNEEDPDFCPSRGQIACSIHRPAIGIDAPSSDDHLDDGKLCTLCFPGFPLPLKSARQCLFSFFDALFFCDEADQVIWRRRG